MRGVVVASQDLQLRARRSPQCAASTDARRRGVTALLTTREGLRDWLLSTTAKSTIRNTALALHNTLKHCTVTVGVHCRSRHCKSTGFAAKLGLRRVDAGTMDARRVALGGGGHSYVLYCPQVRSLRHVWWCVGQLKLEG